MTNSRGTGITIAAIIFLALAPAPRASAYDARLTWPPSTDPDVQGYRVYWGDAKHSYTNSADAGNSAEYVITGLEDGKPYYFTVTAYGSSREESSYSNEIERAADGSITSTPSPASSTAPDGAPDPVTEALGSSESDQEQAAVTPGQGGSFGFLFSDRTRTTGATGTASSVSSSKAGKPEPVCKILRAITRWALAPVILILMAMYALIASRRIVRPRRASHGRKDK